MISDMYESLKEEDLWGGLWQKRAKIPETVQAVALEQQGLFNQALSCYERSMLVMSQEVQNTGSFPFGLTTETEVTWKHYLRQYFS